MLLLPGSGDGGVSFIVASWGSPFSWERVAYKSRIEACPGESVESPTSLDLLVKCLEGKGRRVKVVVFVQETLLATNRWFKSRDGKCVQAPAGDYIPDYYEDPPSDSESYRGILEKLGEGIVKWITDNTGVDGNSVSVNVAPGIGEFNYIRTQTCEPRSSITWTLPVDDPKRPIDANPVSYYQAFTFLKILHEMLKVKEATDTSTRVALHVDLTHGLNYTVQSLIKASITATRVFSASTHKPVDVRYYNSEPYVRGVKSLNVWEVASDRITPRKAASKLSYTFISVKAGFPGVKQIVYVGKPGKLKGEEYKRLGENYESLMLGLSMEVARLSTVSTLIGAPLLMAQAGYRFNKLLTEKGYTSDSSSDVVGYLNSIVSHYSSLYPSVEIERRPVEGDRIVHRIALMARGVMSLLAGLALDYYTLKAWEKIGKPMPWGENCMVPASIKQLDRMKDHVVSPSYRLVDHEISMLRRSLKGKSGMIGGNDLYMRVSQAAKYLAQGVGETVCIPPSDRDSCHKCTGECNVKEPDHRVFVAHAGLNSDIIEVHYIPGAGSAEEAVKLSYLNCREMGRVLYNASVKLLEELAGRF